ncbi:MAG TPA: alkaline phosphatase [Spirochaetia bacterium]|nr:alkaline phosphatase [Spirochaetia bacterium]HRZ66131.1 alkaline phosphatase [Spirochaetia bacterium]
MMRKLSRAIAALGLAAALAVPAAAAPKAKYVFLFIGDGMALAQINSAAVYANAMSSKEIAIKPLGFSKLPVSGLTTTHDASSFITDSASAGTAMATGNKTLSGVINMDPGKTVKYRTIAEEAKALGMKVGIVSSVSIDHATPASFYAKVPSRSDYYAIGEQLAASGFDYFGGGGFLQPKGKKGDQAELTELAAKAGYKVVAGKERIMALRKGSGKVLAVESLLQDASALHYDMDRPAGAASLADFTRVGIELLGDAPKGFFMMVEGGKIDWACHANDAASSIKDTLAFDAAVSEALAFMAKHPKETLIVVTGDHETGGMSIGFAGTQYSTFFDKVAKQTMSFQRFNDEVVKPYKDKAKKDEADLADLLPAIKAAFGLELGDLTPLQQNELQFAFNRTMGNQVVRAAAEDAYLLYGGYEPLTVKLTQILNQAAGIGWTSYAHTGVPVATFAKGSGQELFGGLYDNTDIYRKLCSAMGIQKKN